MKLLKGLLAILFFLFLIFILGPRPSYPDMSSEIPSIDLSLEEIPTLLAKNDSEVVDLRPGNASQLIWADSLRQTDYALLYLHGFSASPVEGAPLHQEIARRYSMNFYAPLLAGHGSASKESFVNTSPQDWIADASEAIAVAQTLGKQIIIMSCSTGSTLAVYLAAKHPELIAGHIMYSPNFELADGSSKIMSYPWGLQIARAALGSDYRSFSLNPDAKPFWTTTYRVEGLQALRYLLDGTMTTDIWKKFDDPYLIAYYYESPTEQDDIISIDAIADFHKLNASPKAFKQIAPLAEPKSHVIASPLQSKNVEVVKEVTIKFMDQLMQEKTSDY